MWVGRVIPVPECARRLRHVVPFRYSPSGAVAEVSNFAATSSLSPRSSLSTTLTHLVLFLRPLSRTPSVVGRADQRHSSQPQSGASLRELWPSPCPAAPKPCSRAILRTHKWAALPYHASTHVSRMAPWVRYYTANAALPFQPIGIPIPLIVGAGRLTCAALQLHNPIKHLGTVGWKPINAHSLHTLA